MAAELCPAPREAGELIPWERRTRQTVCLSFPICTSATEPMGCAWAEGSRAVCCLVSPALPDPVSLLSPEEAAVLGQLLAIGWLLMAIRASFAQQNHLLWAFTALGSGSGPPSPSSHLHCRIHSPDPHGCSGTAEQEPSRPRANKSPFAPWPPTHRAGEVPSLQGSRAWPDSGKHGTETPKHPPAPALLPPGTGPAGAARQLSCTQDLFLSLHSER